MTGQLYDYEFSVWPREAVWPTAVYDTFRNGAWHGRQTRTFTDDEWVAYRDEMDRAHLTLREVERHTPERGPAGPAETTFDRAAAPHPGGHQAGQVQATPRQDHTPSSSRGVNEDNDGPRAIGTASKDASATPAARRVPAPLLNLWAIAALLLGLCIAIPTALFLTHP